MPVTPTNGYCTGDELKAALSISGTADDASLERAIDTASRAIDRWCGRRFWVDGSDTTRYFTPTGRSLLRLGPNMESMDIVSVTTVTVDTGRDGTFGETWTSGTDFFLAPRSAGEEDRGYTGLQAFKNQSVWTAYGPDTVKIVGKFGWPSVPDDVTEATIIQASRIWKRVREAPFGIAGATLDGGGIRLLSKLDADVQMLVSPFQRVMVA